MLENPSPRIATPVVSTSTLQSNAKTSIALLYDVMLENRCQASRCLSFRLSQYCECSKNACRCDSVHDAGISTPIVATPTHYSQQIKGEAHNTIIHDATQPTPSVQTSYHHDGHSFSGIPYTRFGIAGKGRRESGRLMSRRRLMILKKSSVKLGLPLYTTLPNRH
jgi:hypothetical protein